MYDIIGDIQSQNGKLEALLVKLKYFNRDGLWIPKNGRKVVFLGDLMTVTKIRSSFRLQVVDPRFQACKY